MEQQFGDQISPQDYLGLLRFSLEHDQKLQKYFEVEKKMDKFKIVSERIPLIIADIQECITMLKGGK